MQSEAAQGQSQLNSIPVEGQQGNAPPSGRADLNATPNLINLANPEALASVGERRLRNDKHSLPPISLGMFSMTSSPSSSPPAVATPPPCTAGHRSAQRNGLAFANVARHHRPVVRSQSSRISLLRQPPQSASSVTSGTDVEHFPMPDK